MPVLRSGKRSKSVGFRVREESIQQTKKVYLSYLGIETSASETGESDADSGSNSFQNFGVRESKAFLQEYFSQSTKVLTTDEDEEAGESEHGSTLNVPFAALREWLQVADQKLPKSAKQLSQLYESQFDKWMVYMSENFNVLLYGFGSKLDLVERFRKAKLLGTYNHIVLHGYQPSASVKQLLALLVERLRLKISPSSSSSPIELSYAVCQALESMKKPCDVFIVVHNIDGVALRNHVAQTVLCVLADSPFVHIIASVDHVNAALMWDQTKLAKFSWLWTHVTTFRSYTTEILANDLKALGLSDVKHGGTHSVASLRSIWKSLTPNAKSAFLQLISLVLTDDASASSSGVTFWVWYRSCLDEFVVSSELALRQHLREFTDHHMVSKKTGLDGAEILTLNIDRHLLAEFFAQDDININIPGLSPQ